MTYEYDGALGPTTDLNVFWDAEASRLARVLVARGRMEVVLCEPDEPWVRAALEAVAEQQPVIVIACPEART